MQRVWTTILLPSIPTIRSWGEDCAFYTVDHRAVRRAAGAGAGACRGRRARPTRIHHQEFQDRKRHGPSRGAHRLRHLRQIERERRQRHPPAVALHGGNARLWLAHRARQGAGSEEVVSRHQRVVRQRPIILAQQHAGTVSRPPISHHHHPRQRRGRASNADRTAARAALCVPSSASRWAHSRHFNGP